MIIFTGSGKTNIGVEITKTWMAQSESAVSVNLTKYLHTLYFTRRIYKERFSLLDKNLKKLRNRLVIFLKTKEQTAQ